MDYEYTIFPYIPDKFRFECVQLRFQQCIKRCWRFQCPMRWLTGVWQPLPGGYLNFKHFIELYDSYLKHCELTNQWNQQEPNFHVDIKIIHCWSFCRLPLAVRVSTAQSLVVAMKRVTGDSISTQVPSNKGWPKDALRKTNIFHCFSTQWLGLFVTSIGGYIILIMWTAPQFLQCRPICNLEAQVMDLMHRTLTPEDRRAGEVDQISSAVHGLFLTEGSCLVFSSISSSHAFPTSQGERPVIISHHSS